VIELRRRTWLVKQRGQRWCVQRQDGTHADSLHERKEDAIARGADLGARAHGRLIVKDQSGRVVDERVYFEDG
jgi:hypothetical protein